LGAPTAFRTAEWIFLYLGHDQTLEGRADYFPAAIDAGCWITKSGSERAFASLIP
jgi:hypothetical protein